jgi:hypothetical protein
MSSLQWLPAAASATEVSNAASTLLQWPHMHSLNNCFYRPAGHAHPVSYPRYKVLQLGMPSQLYAQLMRTSTVIVVSRPPYTSVLSRLLSASYQMCTGKLSPLVCTVCTNGRLKVYVA